MCAHDYSSKAVEVGSVRWNLIGSCPRAATPDRWGTRPYQMVGGPHLSGGVFLSFLEYSGVDVWVFSLCNLTCGPPFVIILRTPYRNRHSLELMEFC